MPAALAFWPIFNMPIYSCPGAFEPAIDSDWNTFPPEIRKAGTLSLFMSTNIITPCPLI